MEIGQYQLQIFISFVVILSAACVALICDFLKGNNEQLRELTIELKVRREEEQKRSHLLTPRVAAPKTERIAAPAAAAAVSNVAVSNVPVSHMAAPKERSAVGKERKRTVNSEAIAAMERGAALASSGKRPRSAPVAPVREAVAEVQPETIIVSQQENGKPMSITLGSGRKDWGSLLSRNAQRPAAPVVIRHDVSHDLLAAVVAATNSNSSGLPAGFQDGFVLNKLVQSHQPVSGLVVSIGVNASRKSDRKMPEAVSKLVESLIGPNDFAAQSGEDEFLLIYPQESGASAQRRLSQIAQQLWDFQLRSLGSFQILFSWGGVEVRSESIDEAIASASERMQETKRGRKLLTMESPAAAADPGKPAQLRQAV
jgi:hypothetical protein